MRALGRRSVVVVIATLVAFALAFALAFAVARGMASDSTEAASEPAQPLPAQPVTVNNLERAPTMKPLRSIAGEPVP
jgi:hypothetical protein